MLKIFYFEINKNIVFLLDIYKGIFIYFDCISLMFEIKYFE